MIPRLLLFTILVLLAACVIPGSGEDSLQPEQPSPPTTAPTLVVPAATADPAVPTIVLRQSLGAGELLLIRYEGAGQTCIAATFTAEMLQSNRCGTIQGAGVGYVDTLTDPAGQEFRVAYGLVTDPTITAVAVEFEARGANTNAPVQNGGYALMLESNQTPRRAFGINQFGNLVGEWGFQ